MTLRAYKYRIYPNQEQIRYLESNFDAVRFVWNQLVASFCHNFIGPPVKQCEKSLKESYEWLQSSISYALQQKRMDFEETKKQFFSKSRKKKLGRPQFKKKGRSTESFRIPGQKCGNSHIDLNKGLIKLPKMTPIKLIVDREFNGLVKSVTVSKNKCNQYFVSVLVEEQVELKRNTGRSVGIDLGLNDLIVMSNGIKFGNQKSFCKNQVKLKRAQQHLSRKVKGSNRYQKQKLKVAKIHLKIANEREWLNHNISTWLVNNFDVICTENLNVAGMMKSNLAKSISDSAWSSLINMIEYKANWYGRTFHKIDRWFPSSKTCSNCGHKMPSENLSLNVRDWICPSCGIHHDRDLNAATNILNEGLKTLYDFSSEELSEYRRGEFVSPKVTEVQLPTADSVKRLASFVNDKFIRNV